MTEIRRVAQALFDMIRRRPVDDQALRAASEYFSRGEIGIEPQTYRRWLTEIQRDLDNQHELLRLGQRWEQRLHPHQRFTRAQAGEFHRQYIAALDMTKVLSKAVVAGYARRRAGSAIDMVLPPPAAGTAWLLYYTCSGSARLRAGLREQRLQAGAAVLMSPQAMFSLQRSADARHWAHYWVSFQPHSRWRPSLEWPALAPHVGYLQVPSAQRAPLEAALAALLDANQRVSPMKVELDSNLLEQVLLRCRNTLGDIQHSLHDERIGKAQRYVEEHYNRAFTLRDVAGAAHLSPSRLSALFREQTGISVFAWRDQQRMIQAAQLLRGSRLPVAAIGARVGLADPTYFSRTFQRHVGCSPRAYRRGTSTGPALSTSAADAAD